MCGWFFVLVNNVWLVSGRSLRRSMEVIINESYIVLAIVKVLNVNACVTLPSKKKDNRGSSPLLVLINNICACMGEFNKCHPLKTFIYALFVIENHLECFDCFVSLSLICLSAASGNFFINSQPKLYNSWEILILTSYE